MSPKAQLLEFLTQHMESAFSRRQSKRQSSLTVSESQEPSDEGFETSDYQAVLKEETRHMQDQASNTSRGCISQGRAKNYSESYN